MPRPTPIPSTATLRRLRAQFAVSEKTLGQSIPIRKTVAGIWVPTPTTVIESALPHLVELGLLGPTRPPAVVDAGTGDARLPAYLAAWTPTQVMLGIEQDGPLFEQAETNLSQLAAGQVVDADRIRLVRGDYTDAGTYRTAGLAAADVGLFLNYPDGNQETLAQFVAEEAGPDAMVCLLTHDVSMDIRALSLRAERDVVMRGEPSWRLAIYERW